MISFKKWKIKCDGLEASQYDNLSCRLDVIGDLPEGWDWAMLVQVDDAMDIIPLAPIEGGVGTALTRDQLSIGDRYYFMQLRGTQGDVVRHTNIIQVFIPRSLSGDGQWPTVPSAFLQLEQRILEMNSHPPIPGQNGCWLLWDVDADQYVESQLSLPDAEGIGKTAGAALNQVRDLLHKAVYTEDVSAMLTGLEDILAGGEGTGGEGTGGGPEEPVVIREDLTFCRISERYPNLTTFAYTPHDENTGGVLMLPSTTGGGTLSLSFDESRFVNFQTILYLLDKDGAPYKLGKGTNISGEAEITWSDPGKAPGWSTIAGSFTYEIPDGCNIMMAFQSTGGTSSDGTMNGTDFLTAAGNNEFLHARVEKKEG